MSKLISKIVVPDLNEATGYALYNVKDANAIRSSEKGTANGVATLDNTGKIPSSQIPSGIISQQSDWNQTDSTAGDYIKNKPTSMPASDVSAWAKTSSKPTYTASEVGAIPTSAKGAASGVAELDTTGKVPTSQLPSYVDDVLEYANKASFPTTGETGKIYVDKATNLTWRWGGSAYVEISPSLALGETSSTAYAGDKGKALADKLATIAEGAEVNVQSDWNATSGDAFIKNKPTIPAAVTESTVSGWGFTKNTGTVTGIKMNGSSKGTSGVVDLGTVVTNIKAAAGSHINEAGTPSVTASTVSGVTTFTFDYLKGAKGDPGQNATTTSVFSTSANGLAPAASSGNKTTAETAVSNYYLCADGKYRQLPANAFKNDNTWTAASTSAAGYVPAATKGKFLHSNASTGNLEWVNDNNTTYTPQKLGSGIGTCSTSSGTALTVSLTGYELVKNGFVAVTFSNDVPASATLNINGKGAKPIIYKSAAITADTIKADDTVMFAYDGINYVVTSLGGGGAAPVNPNETVNISLTQVGGNSADLTGASITITNDDTSEIILTTTWQGSTITEEIEVGTPYTISVETITGYLTCPDQSYMAGYQTEKNVTFTYRISGVYIESTDHNLYTSSTWASAGKTANAIVVLTDNCKFRIALTQTQLPVHSNSNDPINNYLAVKTQEQAEVDYDGAGNTAKIIQFNTAYSTNTTSYAAPYCNAFTFPDGSTHGILGSGGQWKTLWLNKSAVNACITACGGTGFIEGTPYYWCSDCTLVQNNTKYLGVFNWGATFGYAAARMLTTNAYVRPFASYE